ncbi:MAG TPA: DUF1206 domain-containing protein [Gemmatimonadales bacterium]|nr:DUF1206 domain-containing protein [Gemmatimonadales bacterium]
MRPAPRWIERLARVGIVAKAAVYLAIGILATGVALEAGGVLTGGEGVLRLLVRQPMGRGLLALLAFGFAAYTVWLLAQAVVDPDGNGASFVGIVNRLGQTVIGIAHVALTWEAKRLALGLPGGEGVGIEGLVGSILQAPFGPWPLRVGRFGLAARGVVLSGAGVLVIRAATSYDPQQAGGVGDVLAQLWQQPASHWLLGAVALGLVAYGAFALIEARYRFIPSA